MKRKQALIAGLACVVFMLDGLTAATCWVKTQTIEKRIVNRHKVIEQLGKVESAATSLGSFAHRYVLGPSAASLQDYYQAEARMQGAFELLGTLIRDNQIQQLYRVGLLNGIVQRLDWEHIILSTYEAQGKEAALNLILTRNGGASMDRIRSQIKEIDNMEKLHLQSDSADYERYKLSSLIAIILLSIGGAVALWQAIKMFSRSAKLEAERALAYERMEQMNEQLNKQVSELLKSQEDTNDALTVRSQFLARVSHELRTPLAGIIGATELALEAAVDQDQRELIQTANQSSNILLELVNDILDFEKLEQQRLQLEPASFDLSLAINAALEPLKMRAKNKGIAFRVHIDSQTPRIVFSDRLRIQQVLVNLVDNATKFTDSGAVALTVSVDEKNSTRAIVRFTVSDTGVGIRPEQLNLIWEPFNKVDGFSTSRYGGCGLGLSISKKLVEVLQGEIEVSSVPEEGSTFIFKVPLDLREAPTPHPEPLVPVVLSKSASILVVDDSVTICKVTGAQLESLGYHAELVTTGKAAIELTGSKHFDLILMDIQMPEMDGIQTTGTIRSAVDNKCKNVPIIAYTAHAMLGDEEKYLGAGMSGYLAKPVMLSSLRQTVEKWIKLGSTKETIALAQPKS